MCGLNVPPAHFDFRRPISTSPSMSKTDCISTLSDPSELALRVTSSRSNQVFAHGATCFVFQCQLAVELGIDIVKVWQNGDGSGRVGHVSVLPGRSRNPRCLVVFGFCPQSGPQSRGFQKRPCAVRHALVNLQSDLINFPLSCPGT